MNGTAQEGLGGDRVERREAGDLRWRFRLLLVAVLCSGVFEVIDNVLGLRTSNVDTSAPVAFKLAKEVAILWVMAGIVAQYRRFSATPVWSGIALVISLAFAPQILFLPSEGHTVVGLIYFVGSGIALIAFSGICTSRVRDAFVQQFLLPYLVICLTTQIAEALLSPISFYSETNLLGLDRRAGIAVIPTTAGLLGVVGVMTLRRIGRVVALLVVLMANSSLSLICLAVVLGLKVRPRWAVIIALPVVMLTGGWALSQREGLQTSVESRIEIAAHSVEELRLFAPSVTGATATAKSVAVAPQESYIADSMYVEVLHVMGIIPGAVFISALFLLVYRCAGVCGLAMISIAGIGYLVIEAWIVWFAFLCGFARSERDQSPRRGIENERGCIDQLQPDGSAAPRGEVPSKP